MSNLMSDARHLSNLTAGAPSHGATAPFDLASLLRVLRRRKRALVLTLLTVLSACLAGIFLVTPKYTADAVVMIDSRSSNVVNIDSVVSALKPDAEQIQTEMQVLQSHQLAKRVIGKTELDKSPEFTRPSLKQQGCELIGSYVSLEVLGHLCAPGTAEDAEGGVIDAYLKSLKVEQVDKSRAIRIAFQAEDRRLAADVANTIATLYLTDQLEAKFDATQRASKWLADRVSELRQRTAQSERAVEAYRATNGLTMAERSTVLTQQITETTAALTAARAQASDADAKLRQIKAVLNSGGDPGILVKTLEAPLLLVLYQQQADLKQKYATNAEQYGKRHPTMIALKGALDDTQRRIDAEIRKQLETLANEVKVAEGRAASAQANLEGLQTEAKEATQKEVELRSLTREAMSNRLLLENFLNRSKETAEQQGFAEPDARVISYASVPVAQSFPKKIIFVPLALALAIVCGVAVVFALEQLYSGFSSATELETVLGIPVLSILPRLTGRKVRRRLGQYVIEKPRSLAAESVRSLHSSLWISDVHCQRTRTVAIASTLPGEGKTTAACWLARIAASAGRSVIVVDCDLRKPSVHREFGVPNGQGLTEVLRAGAVLEAVVRRDSLTAANFITAGRAVGDTSSLLQSEAMRRLVQRLEENYDLVVFDTPPILLVADAKLLAVSCDQTFLVCRWMSTGRKATQRTLTELRAVGAEISGAVMTLVDMKRHSMFSEYDDGVSRSAAKRYYIN